MSPRGRVLIIDDDTYLARALQKYLENHTVHLAADGAEGLKALRRGLYDVILCDITMPNVTGVDVYNVVRRDLPSVLGKMVFMTGALYSDSIQHFARTCPVPIVEKPFDLPWMRELVGRYVVRDGARSPARAAAKAP